MFQATAQMRCGHQQCAYELAAVLLLDMTTQPCCWRCTSQNAAMDKPATETVDNDTKDTLTSCCRKQQAMHSCVRVWPARVSEDRQRAQLVPYADRYYYSGGAADS